MKKSALVSLLLITSLAAAPLAAQGMPGMKGMDMSAAEPGQAMHTARGVVKRLDPAAGRITLAHRPVASLNWPSMTMSFGVRDRALTSGLVEGAELEADFVREGKDWIITAVR
ncbi:MAG: copper-binding protein [Zoogloeaceae bacterium]|nr:copper-binding protein [Zoogloeaceae bacterium]